MGQNHKHKDTETWSSTDPAIATPSSNPVIALYDLHNDELWPLYDFRNQEQAKKLVSVGSANGNAIQVRDTAVSGHHCVLCCTDGNLFVQHSPTAKNATKVNHRYVSSSTWTKITPRDTLRVGRVRLVALSAATLAAKDYRARIIAIDIHVFLRAAWGIYGTLNRTARILHITASTMSRWLTRHKYDTSVHDDGAT